MKPQTHSLFSSLQLSIFTSICNLPPFDNSHSLFLLDDYLLWTAVHITQFCHSWCCEIYHGHRKHQDGTDKRTRPQTKQPISSCICFLKPNENFLYMLNGPIASVVGLLVSLVKSGSVMHCHFGDTNWAVFVPPAPGAWRLFVCLSRGSCRILLLVGGQDEFVIT